MNRNHLSSIYIFSSFSWPLSSFLDFPTLFQQNCTAGSTVYLCDDALMCTMTVLPQFSDLLVPSNGASGSLTASCTWNNFYSPSFGGDQCRSPPCINSDGSLSASSACPSSNYDIGCGYGSCSLVSGEINPLYTPDHCANAAQSSGSPVQGYANGAFSPEASKCNGIGSTETTPWYQEPTTSFVVSSYTFIHYDLSFSLLTLSLA